MNYWSNLTWLQSGTIESLGLQGVFVGKAKKAQGPRLPSSFTDVSI